MKSFEKRTNGTVNINYSEGVNGTALSASSQKSGRAEWFGGWGSRDGCCKEQSDGDNKLHFGRMIWL